MQRPNAFSHSLELSIPKWSWSFFAFVGVSANWSILPGPHLYPSHPRSWCYLMQTTARLFLPMHRCGHFWFCLATSPAQLEQRRSWITFFSSPFFCCIYSICVLLWLWFITDTSSVQGHRGFQFFSCTSRLTFNLSPPCSILALSYPIWRLGAPPWPTNVPGSNQVVAGTFLKVRHNIHGEPSHVHYVLTVHLIVMAIMQSPASVEEIWLFATKTQRFYSWNLSTSTYWSKDRGWPNLTTDHSRSRPADILILLPSWNMSKPAALEVKCCWLASCPVEDKNIC